MTSVGLRVSELTTPAFLVDKAKVETNCSNMIDTCKKLGLKLRAQTKTHKTIEGAVLQTGGSKRGLVTSTLQEAEFYATHGFDDILYGYPFIPFHLPRVTELTRRLEQFHVLVDSALAVDTLAKAAPPPGKAWSVFLKVDCGNKRAGVWWEEDGGVDLAVRVWEAAGVTLAGLYVHCGDSYHAEHHDKDTSNAVAEAGDGGKEGEGESAGWAGGPDKVRDQTIERLLNFAGRVRERGVVCPTIGIGSTPTCSRPAPNMNQLTELHPGNYIFYDAQQVSLGSCQVSEVACCVATRVIGHYPHRNQLLIDCGFTGLTKQGMDQLPGGCCIFKDHANLRLSKMTQEIGFVDDANGDQLEFDKFPIGSLLFLLPWHSCATAAMYSVYHVMVEDEVVDEWRPTRGW